MENKIEKAYFSLADFEEEEKYLSSKHSEGWKFVKANRGKYYFEKCFPEDYIYQLDFKKNGVKDDNYIQLFSDCGWEFVLQHDKWFYFRKKAESDELDTSIFSDNASKIDMCLRVKKGRLTINTAIFGLCCMINVFTVFFHNYTLLPQGSYATDFINAALPWIGGGLFVVTSYSFFDYRKISRKINNLRNPIV